MDCTRPYLSTFVLFSFGILVLPAQSIGFSEGKNLAQLKAAVFERAPKRGMDSHEYQHPQPALYTPSSLHPIFLPKWTPEDLPFFCKIEHDWGLKSRIPIKFRLGSVEYVDWLEGKQ